ncbi:type IV pilus twitching motility protein PilT [Frigoribacterium sp. PhB24]|uniref:type IV pilus twitching motility protein PilT n=1 Tax=Frigoribacterium sp. PhB24 TaxID=2485204 RepID=UPI000FA14B0B|nr:type IV pilus twitching motility protein PilT [Frigoribacterium sp. PhB24]ROS50396.1 twitching motility protein PilT [Frigoribacterium sp. PhB24]
MSASIYDIPDDAAAEAAALAGWTPGRPGNEVRSSSTATASPAGSGDASSNSSFPPAPASPGGTAAAPVYSLDGGQDPVMGWTPTRAPSSRRAARLAEALVDKAALADQEALLVPDTGPSPVLPRSATAPSSPATPSSDAAPAATTPAPLSPPPAGHVLPSPSRPGWVDPRFDEPIRASRAQTTPLQEARAGSATDVAVTAPTAAIPAPAGTPATSPSPSPFAADGVVFPTGTGTPASAPAAAPWDAPAPQHVAADAPTAVLTTPEDTADFHGIELHRHPRDHAHAGLVSALIQVVLQNASDLHVTTDAMPTIRVDGDLRPALAGGTVWDAAIVRTALESLLTPEQQQRFDDELELDFAYSLSDESRFRVNFYQQRGSLGAAFRLIPTEIKQLGDLGVPESVSTFAKLPRGLVLVTGPTGSGKSTTLAALIDLVNRTRADHIVTVEDPIEFMHQHKKSLVNQREVGHDTHSFAAALKHVLRQDPDVILIGELRDLETISVALTAAETGHLVFATLHTQSAAQTIDRVIDVFPPYQQDQVRTQLASTLQGVVCQTLLPKASGRGRVVATEIMMMTPAIGNLVREGKTYQIASSMQAGRDLGMHTMDQKLADLVNTGVVTHKAAMEKVHDREGFDRLVTRVINKSESQGLDSGIDFGDSFSGGAA